MSLLQSIKGRYQRFEDLLVANLFKPSAVAELKQRLDVIMAEPDQGKKILALRSFDNQARKNYGSYLSTAHKVGSGLLIACVLGGLAGMITAMVTANVALVFSCLPVFALGVLSPDIFSKIEKKSPLMKQVFQPLSRELENLEKSPDLDALRRSPRLEEVLLEFPRIKSKFQERALMLAIREDAPLRDVVPMIPQRATQAIEYKTKS